MCAIALKPVVSHRWLGGQLKRNYLELKKCPIIRLTDLVYGRREKHGLIGKVYQIIPIKNDNLWDKIIKNFLMMVVCFPVHRESDRAFLLALLG